MDIKAEALGGPNDGEIFALHPKVYEIRTPCRPSVVVQPAQALWNGPITHLGQHVYSVQHDGCRYVAIYQGVDSDLTQ